MTRILRQPRPDGTEHILVTPDPAIMAIKAAFEAQKEVPASTMRRRFAHTGSLYELIVQLKASGVTRIILEPQKARQLERELRARGIWETHKHMIGEHTDG